MHTSMNDRIPNYRHIFNTFIAQSDGKQIISHQIESFNQFIEVDIPEIIHMSNPITSYGSPEIPLAGPRSALATATGLSTTAANALMGNSIDGIASIARKVQHEYEVTLEFEKISIRKPTIFENNGAIHPMMPNDARLRNLTYAAPLNIDVKVTTTFIDHTRNSIRESNVRIFPNVHLGKIPVMVGSKYCLLNDQKHVHPSKIGECSEDVGGYFIIQGGERAMISMERMSENRPFVFRNGRGSAKEMEVVEIKCIGPDNDQVPKSNTVKMVYHPKNQLITMLRATLPRIKTDIPLMILFRALGVCADKDIYELILGVDNDPTYDPIITESILEASSINTQEQSFAWLAEHTNTWSVKSQKQSNVQDIIAEELFPHIGGHEMNYEKACFLAHMTRKVLWTSSKRIPIDDRDAYPNKRVDIPGFLLADLFRKTYNNRMVKDMKAALSKEIHGGSWKATGNWSEIVNINNINKIIKSTIMDVCLKSSLATGNFGSGKIGGPNKIGVSQVLNRLNYSSSISHLRRISTPIEKTGKLIAPRKQHNTQWGLVCPCETPEGHGVGVIKNMSITSSISIFSSPITVYAFIQGLNKLIQLRESNVTQMHEHTRVFLNGSWIGMLLNKDTSTVVDMLRKAKRSGMLHIYTGIIWKNYFKELWITTEAGRMLRPVYYAPAIREIAADKSGTLKLQVLETNDWNKLLLWETPNGHQLFEYIDSGETEGAYIAMDYDSCVKDSSYTHCEVHPSVIFGTTASYIPFPDHNQSPRNAYQSSMGKQAMGVYSLNFRERFDAMSHVLCYPEKPMVSSYMSRLFGAEKLPAGQNVVVAIMTYTGYNQEDSNMINRASLDRGRFRSIFYRTYKDEERKNQSSGEEEKFCNPDPIETKHMKNAQYDKVGDDGFVPKDTYVTPDDILIGKVVPLRVPTGAVLPAGAKKSRDVSKMPRNNESGYVDKIYKNRNGEGYSFVKIRMRQDRIPEIGDKFSCYSDDTDILTTRGWIPFQELNMSDHVATLMEDGVSMKYTPPLEVMSYDFKGNMYHIESSQIDLLVTPNHRMYVGNRNGEQFGFKLAEDIYGKRITYKKNIEHYIPPSEQRPSELSYLSIDTQEEMKEPQAFILKGEDETDDKIIPIHDWLIIFGVWMAEGCTWDVSFATHKQRVKDELEPLCERIGLEIRKHKDDKNDMIRNAWCMIDKRFVNYIKPLSVESVNKSLPEWVWYLTPLQCQSLIYGMMLGDGHTMTNGTRRYDTSSSQLANDFQRLCLHAGYSTNISLKYKAGHETVIANGYRKGEVIRSTADAYRLTIIEKQNTPLVNKNITLSGENRHDSWVPYDGKVYCCRVQGPGAIYVRRNNVPSWSGNSRHGQKGTMGMILNPEDMPQTSSGIVPDIIINPHCLADDHEILTEKGFMNWIEVKQGYDNGSLRLAGYNHTSGELVYEYPTNFILNESKERQMIEFSHDGEDHPSNGVNLLVTSDHDMFAKKGKYYGDSVSWNGIQKGPRSSSKKIAFDYEKCKAHTLMSSDNMAIKFIGKARNGVIDSNYKLPFETELNLNTIEKNIAFCELYGYWLGDGCLRFGGNSVEMSPVKVTDDAWLKMRFDSLGLTLNDDYTYNIIGGTNNNPVRYRWSIINKKWFNLFCSEYGKKYKKYNNSSNVPEISSSVEPENIKSAKWMAEWVWSIPSSMTRAIMAGLRFADGCEKADRNIIWTSSARFRDEIMRLALHAGYSSHFGIQHDVGQVCGHDKNGTPIVSKHISWKISYSDTSRGSEPVLYSKRDVKQVLYNGLTWCVTMPNGFIITRRATRNEDGVVINASRPIITGQCIPSRMTIAQLMETLMSKIGCMSGCQGDGSPFGETTVEDLATLLRDNYGMEPYGNEIMYNGYTGRMMETSIFIGPCYYQRLRHCSADKMHSRASGPLVMLTRQPAEGRARDGGLRFGRLTCLSVIKNHASPL